MKKKGFDIINLTTLEQLCYASNFLCIKDGQILAIEVEREIKSVLGETLTRKRKKIRTDTVRFCSRLGRNTRTFKIQGGIFPHKKESTSTT